MASKKSPTSPKRRTGKPQAERTKKPEAVVSDVPAPVQADLPVVALGASAGGLEALEAFFKNTPPDTGLAYVVVTHLPLGHKSLLPLLLAGRTTMPVTEVKDGMRLRANHVYVAPPARPLFLVQDRLYLSEPTPKGNANLPIDYFFRSLAREKRENAVGVVLSGTGSDGTLGLREIKAALGLCVVQDERDARYTGMPHSAILGDHPDFILPVNEMPAHIKAFVSTHRSLREQDTDEDLPARTLDALQRIFVRLRARTGHDFSAYKASTMRRRVERRVSVHHLESIEQYAQYVEDNTTEIDLLFNELLIGVTSFFRDAEAFESLSEVIARLMKGKPDGYAFRIWTAGCSTGEEAYSIAMLFRENMEKLNRSFTVQIFATDLDPRAIEYARAGLYPSASVVDLTPKQLKRYFVRENKDTYRVRKDLREMLVFAIQNLINDPPFTKLDLLSCRNLLIYLDSKLQKRLFPVFHYSLKPGGMLFLGSSETIGTFTNLFEVTDKKWKIFRHKEVVGGSYIAEIPSSISTEGSVLAGPSTAPSARRGDLNVAQAAERVLLRELVPPTALIRERGDIVHIHGRTGLFLEPAPGPQNAINIFNMGREGLQLELASAVREASREQNEVVRRGIRLSSGNSMTMLDLRVRPLSEPESLRGLFLVSFEAHRPANGGTYKDDPQAPRSAPRIGELERELQYTKESHQSTIEELETANEELKSTNEELQSTNEELQSTNEELETSKEELQSLNEELHTVNIELQGKLEELSRANDDMTNLLNATDIATIFLDNQLNIKRHTEQAKRIIRLISSDVGRSIGDLVQNLRYENLVSDAHEVLRTLVFKEAEVRGEGDEWYLMRILPYRTMENMIDGLVITFVDITRIKKLQQDETRIAHALQNSPVCIYGQDPLLRVTWSCGTVFGRRQLDVVGKTDSDFLGEDIALELAQIKAEVLRTRGARQHDFVMGHGTHRQSYSMFIDTELGTDGTAHGISCVVAELPKGLSLSP